LSLVDDTGVDDLILALTKLVFSDPNVSITGSSRAASPEILAWSEERAASKMSGIGLSLVQVKSHRVFLVAMNKAVTDKFIENFGTSEFEIYAVSSASECEEDIASAPADALPIAALLAPPTCTESQQAKLKTMAVEKGLPFVVSIPKDALSALKAALAKL
jgi:hypothetical protein